MPKVAVIGDIHGDADLLALLLDRIRADHGDPDLYSVGDLIDRGPDSARVIDICVRQGVRSVLGNHETWLHQYLATGMFDSFALHRIMGGKATLTSYKVDARFPDQIVRELRRAVPQEHREYILGTPLWRKFECDGVIYRVTHGGLDRTTALTIDGQLEMAWGEGKDVPPREDPAHGDALLDIAAEAMPQVFLWSGCNVRNPNAHHFADGSCQVFGHQPVKAPVITRPWIALDTGCGTCPPHRLSAVILPDLVVVQVDHLEGKIVAGAIRDFTMD